MKTISVQVEQGERHVSVALSMRGFTDFDDAKASLVTHLRQNGVTDNGGEVESVGSIECGIKVETDLCGLLILNEDIEAAMRLNGREHYC